MYSVWIAKLLFLVCFFCQSCPSIVGKSFEEDISLTYEQKVKLDKFRDIIVPQLPQDWMKKDMYLVRWLRARNFNLKEAEAMLMNYVHWRDDNNMDNVLNEDWSDFRREYKSAMAQSKDKEGRPLLYVYAGDWDIRKGIVSGKGSRLARYADMILEEACIIVRDMSHTYKNMSQGLLIINGGGLNGIQHLCLRCIPFLLRIVVASELHHPGCCEKIILTNIPAIAEPLIQSARGLFSSTTNEALRVLGTNKQVLKDTLLQFMDNDQLPSDLGGMKSFKYEGEDDNDYSL